MNCKFLLMPAATFAVAPLAMGQIYSSAVLYPLIAPSGFSATSIAIYAGWGNVSAGQTVGEGAPTGGSDQALLWTAAGVVDLNPSGDSASVAIGNNGTQQVGVGYSNSAHAMLWTGTAASAVDLNPTNLTDITVSFAVATDGTQQVGYGWGSGTTTHALLWTGTAASAVDLNPTNLSGFIESVAYGTDGTQQVGYGEGSDGTGSGGRPAYSDHALLWSGTAASAVDLNPTSLPGFGQFAESYAFGVSCDQQVGYGDGTNSNAHALLWSGTAGSAIDLNPTNLVGITTSWAFGTNGSQQVGWGSSSASSSNYALL